MKGSRQILQPSSKSSLSAPPKEDGGDDDEAAVNAIGFSNKEQEADAAAQGEHVKSAIGSRRVWQSKEEKRSFEREESRTRKKQGTLEQKAVFGVKEKKLICL